MFVPAGWPHAVMNLDMTVAVTQNYVSTATFADAWRHTKASARSLVPSCVRLHRLPRMQATACSHAMFYPLAAGASCCLACHADTHTWTCVCPLLCSAGAPR